mgnify:CR=1 FL=1
MGPVILLIEIIMRTYLKIGLEPTLKMLFH